MKYADLHIHSSYSDGILTPEQIVSLAKKQGIKYISITDHDTINSQYITKINDEEIRIIPGIEFSTEYNNIELHILGYFMDLDNKNLKFTLDKVMKSRVERARKIIDKLNSMNINITMEDVLEHGNHSIGRGNIAKAIVSKGYAKNYKEAFDEYLMQGRAAYVKGEKLTFKEVLNIINDSGGLAILAHPGKIYKSIEVEGIIKMLKCHGMKGIEVYHPSHSKEQINTFYNLSKKYKLLISGGSDFHSFKRNGKNIGSQGINELLLEKIINFKEKL